MFKNLATFKAVYEARSFSRAADLLFIAQPTVSAQIKQLETEFGAQLFVRNGRGEIGLTQAADTLYAQTLQLLGTWNTLHTQLQATAAQKRTCRLASSHTFATYILPHLLPMLEQTFANVQFSVHMGNSQDVQTRLLHHDADIGFIEKPLASTQLHRTVLLADQLVHAGTSGPWLTREPDSGVYYYTKRYMEEAGIAGPTIEIDNNAVIVNLLQTGFGQSIISQRAAGNIPHQSLGSKFTRQFYMLTARDRQDEDLDDYTRITRAIKHATHELTA